MPLQRIQQRGRKAEVALHELALILGAVHAGQVENKAAGLAVCIQVLPRAVKIILENAADFQAGPGAVPALLDIAEAADQVLSHKAPGAGH